MAIAFSHYDYSPMYVIDKVNAKKKFLWFHNGKYIATKRRYRIDKKTFKKFNKIICVSNSTYSELKKFFPYNNLIVRYNDINENFIIKQSIEFDPKFDKNTVNIVTVGRLFYDKGTDIALQCAKKLSDDKYNFTWYFVGDGGMRKEYEKYIFDNKLENKCILLGSQSNPYPYMKNADIYVQPSRIESFGLTVCEAKILNKFIVASSIDAIVEQLENYNKSILCCVDSNSIYDQIKKYIDNNIKLE